MYTRNPYDPAIRQRFVLLSEQGRIPYETMWSGLNQHCEPEYFANVERGLESKYEGQAQEHSEYGDVDEEGNYGNGGDYEDDEKYNNIEEDYENDDKEEYNNVEEDYEGDNGEEYEDDDKEEYEIENETQTTLHIL